MRPGLLPARPAAVFLAGGVFVRPERHLADETCHFRPPFGKHVTCPRDRGLSLAPERCGCQRTRPAASRPREVPGCQLETSNAERNRAARAARKPTACPKSSLRASIGHSQDKKPAMRNSYFENLGRVGVLPAFLRSIFCLLSRWPPPAHSGRVTLTSLGNSWMLRS